MADKTQWSKPRGDVTSVEQFAGREWERHESFVTTMCLSVPASTIDPQALAVASQNTFALDFSFISTSSTPSRSHTLLSRRVAEFRRSTAEVTLHHTATCREPSNIHACFRDGRQDGRYPLDIWTEFFDFISGRPFTSSNEQSR